jgi:AraC-like DNA-binding protein
LVAFELSQRWWKVGFTTGMGHRVRTRRIAAGALEPLAQQEVTIRLLTGPHGPQLRHLVTSGSPSQQIAKAVAWLKQNFVQALHGDDLADRAHMSPSTFRQHFRALTGVSPLQYQKQLRLQEARQLMLNENLDAGSAGGRVGYESASQFSREYSRPVWRAASARRQAHAAGSRCRHRRLSNGNEVDNSRHGHTPSIDTTVAVVSMNRHVARPKTVRMRGCALAPRDLRSLIPPRVQLRPVPSR